MKKLLSSVILSLSLCTFPAILCTACDEPAPDGVNLVAVTAAEVGVREGVDYYVVPEPAASTMVSSPRGLKFAGSLQELYGGESGYPQAVVVAKNEIANTATARAFMTFLTESVTWLSTAEPEHIAGAVQSHLSEGMSPTFKANNLSKAVIQNCSVNFKEDCKAEIIAFMNTINTVGDTSFGLPQDNFFYGGNTAAASYDGKITVYMPDGAPALGLAGLMSAEAENTEYRVVDASTIQTFVTGNAPKADICVLPVNLAVKLLGSGNSYKLLGTLTHGNLYLLTKDGAEVTKNNINSLKGKTVGVINLAQVPGLTFKAILKNNNIDYSDVK